MYITQWQLIAVVFPVLITLLLTPLQGNQCSFGYVKSGRFVERRRKEEKKETISFYSQNLVVCVH